MGVLSSTEAFLPVSSRFFQIQRLDRLFLFDSLLNVLSIPCTWPPVFLYQKAKRSSHQMHTVEFADIRIRAALPLHPYLYKHPHLFLRLVADESVCGDTAGVDGDLASGVWEFNGRLYAPRVKQSLNVTVLTGLKGPGIPVVSVTLKVAELLAQEKACPNRHQYIEIFDSRGVRQLKLVMMCSIKLSPILGRVSKAVGDKGNTIERHSRNDQSDFDPEKWDLSSREDLETLHKMTTSIPDGDERRARLLSLLGENFRVLYDEERRKADLEKAISMHEEAMQFTGAFHTDLAEHTHSFAVALTKQFQQSGDRIDIERAVSYLQTTLRFTGDLDTSKPSRVSNLGMALRLRYKMFHGLIDLENSILCQREAIGGTPNGHPNRPGLLMNLGSALLSRFERLGVPADLEDAISNLRQAVQPTPNSHPGDPGLFNNLGAALRSRFERLGDLTDLEEAISNLQQAVQLTPDGHHEKLGRTRNLGMALQSRFNRLGSLADLEHAISIFRPAIQLTMDDHPDRPLLFNGLGSALQSRFERLGVLADLEDGISNFRQAVRLTPNSHPDKPGLFSNLGSALRSRFERLGVLADLEDAISSLRQAVQLTPNSHPNKLHRFNSLGLALRSRFDRLDSLTDLEQSISTFQKAIQLTIDSHPDKPGLLTNLGTALQSRFERLGVLADLEDAISNHKQAVQLTPDGHNQMAGLSNLGAALRSRFDRLGSLADLEHAISKFQQAIQLTVDSHPDKPGLFNNLGSALRARFERLGVLADLEDAISNHQQAVQLAPNDLHQGPRQLSNLGAAFQSRFDRLGSLADLEHAISNFQQAIQLTMDNHPDKPLLFNNLGSALQSRFEHLGVLADLEDGISNLRQAAQVMIDSHPYKPSLFNRLGFALRSRFEHLGVIADLEDAISNLRRAAQLAPDGHPDNLARFNGLGIALLLRFERLGSLPDLEDAVSNLRHAAQLMPDGHPEELSLLNSLGLTLQFRFEWLGVLADLEDSISYLQHAAQLMPDGNPDKSKLFNNLGISLKLRFDRLGGLTDLEDAISNLQHAVQLTPDSHHKKLPLLNTLGVLFESRFRSLGIPSDLETALFTLSATANSRIGSAMDRFKAARAWARFAEEQSRSPLDAFNCAINLLPRIAWLGLAVTDQHALLADVGGIVRDAVAAAIKYEEYETAVVWAEQGRSIVWQNLLGLRSPVDDLRETHPELADRLHSIAKQLEGSGSPLEGPTASAGDDFPNYSKLAIEWDNIVDEVRRIPRFEGFLKAKSFRQLTPATHEGPVVILNVTKAQCDALVLISDDLVERKVSTVHIPLERFSYEKSQNMFQTLTELLSAAGVRERNDRKTGRAQSQADGEGKFKVILGILWKDVVKPVIEALAFQIEPKRPPRIWWCVTGLLAFLPIHAAGLYDTSEVGEIISDYVISSYTPTLNAILELSNKVAHEDFQVLTVAQPSTPGAQPIPETEDEVRIIHGLTAGARRVNLIGKDATVDRVQKEMTQSNWIHLACHGKQNSDNPMESGFLLYDRMLKLSEIVKMSLPKTDFAFLSACQTAMGDQKVAEESVHLAAGMLLSGCRGVIATTWSIRDEDGPKIAEDVYSRIFKEGRPNRKEAAYALHEAVKRLRESGAQCTSWVPFIHIGR